MSHQIGMVGAGTMGNPIAKRLLEGGQDVVVCDVTEAAIADLVEAGAHRADTPREVAERCEIVFTSLPGPDEVDAVVSGADGMLAGRAALQVHVDLSTNAYERIRQLRAVEEKAGVELVDAPVSGGVAGAVKGSLAVMASGDQDAFDRVKPLLELFSSKTFYLGDSGSGTMAKLINNLVFLCGSLLVQEGFVLGAKAGLDTSQLLEILKASSGGMYAGMAPLIFARDFENTMFKLSIAEKDVALALESAKTLGVSMPVTEAGHGTYHAACEAGLGSDVFYSTLQLLERKARTSVPKLD